jgi:hypothetical protein
VEDNKDPIPFQTKIARSIADEVRRVIDKGHEQENRMLMVSAGEISPFDIMETPFQKAILTLTILWHPDMVISVDWILWGSHILTIEPPENDSDYYLFAQQEADLINSHFEKQGFDVARMKEELIQFQPDKSIPDDADPNDLDN